MKLAPAPGLPGAPPTIAAYVPPLPISETVLVVHGTFALPWTFTGPNWWMPGGSFSSALDGALAQRNAPARCWSHLGAGRNAGMAREPFCWTSANSERSRRAAGYALLTEIDALHADPKMERIHIVAHSHGGNALLHALSSTMQSWPKLGELVFLGTPFLRPADAAARPRVLWSLLVTLVLLAALALWLWPRSEDFWRVWMIGVFGFTLVAGTGYLMKFAGYQRRRGARLGDDANSVTAHVFAFKSDEALRILRSSLEIREDPLGVLDAATKKTEEEEALAARADPRRRDLDMPFRPAAMFVRWLRTRSPGAKLPPTLSPRPRNVTASTPARVTAPGSTDNGLGKTALDVLRAASSGLPPSPITDANQREVVRDAMLILAALLTPLTEFADRWNDFQSWIVSKVRSKFVKMGMQAAARNALGDDLAGAQVEDVSAVPFDARYRRYVIPEELERRINERSRAAASQSAVFAWSGLGTGTLAALSRDLRAVFTADDLAHCRYYQEPQIIEQVAQLIADGRCSWEVHAAATSDVAGAATPAAPAPVSPLPAPP